MAELRKVTWQEPPSGHPAADDGGASGASGATVRALRPPPFSEESEQSVLGCLLLDNAACMERISDVLAPSDFFRPAHRVIYGAVAQLVKQGQGVDPLTVFTQLEGEPVDYGGLPYLTQLAQSLPSAANVRRYAEVVHERATLRALIAQSDEMATAAYSGRASAAVILEQARDGLAKLEHQRGIEGAHSVPILRPKELVDKALSIKWLVKRSIPGASVGLMFGASGAFKSFIALDLALHVAHGLPWLGRRTEQGPVVFVAAEGGMGLAKRIRAWHLERNLRMDDVPLYVIPVSVNMLADADKVAQAVAKVGVRPVLMVVDTASQTFSGDENSNSEVAAYLTHLGVKFRDPWGCSVVVVHHVGHGASDRARGAKAFGDNTEFVLGCFRDEDSMETTVEFKKVKDDDIPEAALFSLKRRVLGTDEDGDEVASLVAWHLTSSDEAIRAINDEREDHSRRGGKHRLLLKLAQNGQPESDLRKLFDDECQDMDAASRKRAYFRAKAWVVKSGQLEFAQGYVLDHRK